MEKIKDFFYDKSDVVFAAIVVSVVVFVVSNSLGGWMFVDAEDNKYSEIQSKIISEENGAESDASQDQTDNNPVTPNSPGTDTQDKSSASAPNNSSTDSTKPNEPTPPTQPSKPQGENRSITVAPGSTAKAIAESLKASGLIGDASVFVQALSSSGKDTKLKAGDFIIPAGSTADQIIDILTK